MTATDVAFGTPATLALAALVLVAGRRLVAGVGVLQRYSIPPAVVGGLLFSQLITLYITPVFYIYMEKLQQMLKRSKAPEAEAAENTGEVVAG